MTGDGCLRVNIRLQPRPWQAGWWKSAVVNALAALATALRGQYHITYKYDYDSGNITCAKCGMVVCTAGEDIRAAVRIANVCNAQYGVVSIREIHVGKYRYRRLILVPAEADRMPGGGA